MLCFYVSYAKRCKTNGILWYCTPNIIKPMCFCVSYVKPFQINAFLCVPYAKGCNINGILLYCMQNILKPMLNLS